MAEKRCPPLDRLVDRAAVAHGGASPSQPAANHAVEPKGGRKMQPPRRPHHSSPSARNKAWTPKAAVQRQSLAPAVPASPTALLESDHPHGAPTPPAPSPSPENSGSRQLFARAEKTDRHQHYLKNV